MNQAHDTWMSSKHGPILGEIDSCIACHAEEGALGYIRAKLSGFRSVYYHITGQITGRYLEVVKGTKPVYCLKSGCHSIKELDTGLKINVNHNYHAEMGFKCVACHDRIAHGWDEGLRSSPGMHNTCFDCHNNKIASHDDCGMCHVYQEKMLKGEKGAGLSAIPSPHIDDLSCRDCHTHDCAPDLETCSSCHDGALIIRLNKGQGEVSRGTEKLKGTLMQLGRIIVSYGLNTKTDDTDLYKEYADNTKDHHKKIYAKDKGCFNEKEGFEYIKRLYFEAMEGYELISKDLSRGAHNFEYTRELLKLSEKKADEAILLLQNNQQRFVKQ